MQQINKQVVAGSRRIDTSKIIYLQYSGLVGAFTHDAEGYTYCDRNLNGQWVFFDGYIEKVGNYNLYFIISVSANFATAINFLVSIGAVVNGGSYANRLDNLQNDVNWHPVCSANAVKDFKTENTSISIPANSHVQVRLKHDNADGVAGTLFIWNAFLKKV